MRYKKCLICLMALIDVSYRFLHLCSSEALTELYGEYFHQNTCTSHTVTSSSTTTAITIVYTTKCDNNFLFTTPLSKPCVKTEGPHDK